MMNRIVGLGSNSARAAAASALVLAIGAAEAASAASPSPAVSPGARAPASDRTRASDDATAATRPDADVTAAIESAFLRDLTVPSNRIDTATNDGTVTLTGTVDDLFAKRRAERIAETVKGVRAVVNDIAIAAGAADGTLREKVEGALFADPATDSYEITTAVADGRVTLTGTVQSGAERMLAEDVVASVAGVRAIDNRLQVAKTARTDQEIEADVRQSMRFDRYLDDAMLDVAVRGGEVTVTGTVGSLAEKRRAGALAWVAGASSIDTTGVGVAARDRGESLVEGKYGPKSDADIDRAVERALKAHPRVSPFDLEVTTADGTVTLRGEVDNLMAQRVAEREARDVVGVWRVKNLIKIRPTPAEADDAVANAIRVAMARDPVVERYDVITSVVDGTAYLSGDVDSQIEKAQAEEIAARVNGVTAVRNYLTVRSPTSLLVYDPYVYPWYPYAYGWYSYDRFRPWKSDWAIREDIRDELAWSPFVDANEVQVTVEDGVATLRGSVDTWSERTAAVENAYEGGARSIVDELQIELGAAPAS